MVLRRITSLTLGTALGVMALPMMAGGQSASAAGQVAQNADGGADASELTEVVVVGSHIAARPNITSAAPITSVTSLEIQQSGALNVEDILNRLPQVSPDNQQTYQDSDGAQKINLRRIGFGRTLTLIDGQRVATNIGLDINIIPVAFLERIDVLSGGASAAYGSDAVAGVVNFMLKKEFTGFQVSGNYSLYDHYNQRTIVQPVAEKYGIGSPDGQAWDGGRGDFNAAWGGKFADGRLNVRAFADYRRTEPVLYKDRDFSACGLIQSTTDGPLSCQTSTYSKYGYFSPQSGDNAGKVFSNAKDGSPTFVTRDQTYAYNSYQDYYLQRQDERINGGLFLNYDLTDSVELYSSYLISSDTSYNQFRTSRLYSPSNFGESAYNINCNNPLMSAQQQQALCGSLAGTGALMPTEVRYQFDSTAQLKDYYLNENQRATAGFRGKVWDAWHYDVGGVYARFDKTYKPAFENPVYQTQADSLNVVNVNGTPTCAAKVAGTSPNCVPANIFVANGGSQALVNFYEGGYGGTQEQVGVLWDATVNVNGDLGHYGITSPLARDGLAVAFGAEYRKDMENNTVDDAFVSNAGYGSNFKASQSVKEGYIEVQAPLVQDRPFVHLLSAQGGYRWSKYDTNPDTFTTWKIEGTYAPVPDVTLRTSYNKAARAPNIYENNQAIDFTSGGSDICAGSNPTASLAACQLTGVTAAQYGHIKQCDDNACLARQGGFVLDPETAHTLTYGAVLKPSFLPGLTLSADRYLIMIDNSIGFNYDDFYSSSCALFATAYYCSHFNRNPDGSLTSYDTVRGGAPSTGFVTYGNTNNYKTFAEGYDFQAQYLLPVPELGGHMDFDFNGSLSTRTGGQDTPNSLAASCVGYFGPRCNQPFPAWTHNLRGTYIRDGGAYSVSLNWRHISGVTNAANSDDPALGSSAATHVSTFTSIPSYDYFDVAVGYMVNDQISLRLTVNNLTDKMPPIVANSYNISLARSNTIPQVYDALGRMVQMGFTVSF
ncbi:TonB-dependent receptor [Nitrospirillum sp. BR 11164]|uniref:TonB-dependent receptor domain-containing protein n=1 Tax=Nitrospirillum sp. BR 11164 TaxID=3104324 RepID=UPI002AFEAA47|nr:TonB-dependent receptor [Nitrospirillum sp. BR 11164]MEA1647417.1 TonB-dependent receptor [Nitrospirillum sp. BR 11164]